MVNFYNDYVTCRKDATLSDVAGKTLIICGELSACKSTAVCARGGGEGEGRSALPQITHTGTKNVLYLHEYPILSSL